MRGHKGGTPNDAPAVLPLALVAAGRKHEAADALLVARQWPIHVFEYTFEALTTLAEVLLSERFEQVIPALEPMRAPEPFFRAGALVAAAESCQDQLRVSWLREALISSRGAGGSVPPPGPDGCCVPQGRPLLGHNAHPQPFPTAFEPSV